MDKPPPMRFLPDSCLQQPRLLLMLHSDCLGACFTCSSCAHPCGPEFCIHHLSPSERRTAGGSEGPWWTATVMMVHDNLAFGAPRSELPCAGGRGGALSPATQPGRPWGRGGHLGSSG